MSQDATPDRQRNSAEAKAMSLNFQVNAADAEPF